MIQKFTYNEAYCLMLYRCKVCGALEILWNSRDGVVPFCISCRFCHEEGTMPNMLHTAWQFDTRQVHYKPFIGQRVFTGKPEEPKVEIVGHKCQDCNKAVEFSFIVCGDCSKKRKDQK